MIPLQLVGGHRLLYARSVAEALVAKGDRAILILPDGATSAAEYAEHMADCVDEIEVVTVDSRLVERPIDLARSFRADLTVILDGDRAIRSTILRGSQIGAFRLLIMREYGQSKTRFIARLQTLGKRIQIGVARARGVDVIVLKSAMWRKRTAGAVSDPVEMRATPTMGRALRAEWGMDDRFWFGILGAHDPRKNVAVFLAAVASSSVRCGVLLAGQSAQKELDATDSDVRSLLAARDIPIRVVDRLLRDEELDSAIQGVDCVVLAHSNEGPSGIFGKALVAGTRVLASGARSLRADCAKTDGASWVPLTVRAIADVLPEVLASADPAPAQLKGFAYFGQALAR